ncbi:MAG: 3-phosphoshikimate 1-carboxyvinyltransferase [Actinobacteria bacterium]|nr:3-phosphoshikimate 1-carboxyvinyltransferase [Actinomycetota bacterium]MBW3641388.1 3-phosphoshikimate 1-carboxyvinyltransferase [Actinomycetota bacterium]
MTALAVEPLQGPFDATVVLPGSKSITNRALVVAALAEGRSVLEGALTADDTEAMADSLVRLGVPVTVDAAAEVVSVEGAGGRVAPGPVELDARLSGTTARFVLPMLALGTGRYRLDGSAPLRSRPMGPTLAALRQLGAVVEEEGEAGHLPVTVVASGLAGGSLLVPGSVSSQFASGLLLTAPALSGGLHVELQPPIVSRPYLELTLAVMEAFGAKVSGALDAGVTVEAGPYQPRRFRVEPDASAASYFFAAAVIGGGRVRVPGLGRSSPQGDLAFVDVLEAMGARVRWLEGAVEVSAGTALRGVEVDMADCSDTAQTLAAVAVFASSPTRVRGIGFIRTKETDRIAAVVAELRRCGIDAEEERDGFLVRPGRPRPARVQTYSDHRMAMSFALLGLRAPGIEIADPDCVAKTFPGFFAAVDAMRRSSPGAG